ncbi:unnamed protein product, partial [Discosporangium mesarthrocarpum]
WGTGRGRKKLAEEIRKLEVNLGSEKEQKVQGSVRCRAGQDSVACLCCSVLGFVFRSKVTGLYVWLYGIFCVAQGSTLSALCSRVLFSCPCGRGKLCFFIFFDDARGSSFNSYSPSDL